MTIGCCPSAARRAEATFGTTVRSGRRAPAARPVAVGSIPDVLLEHQFDSLSRWGLGQDPDLGRPIAAPLARCAELLDVDLATICAAAANVEPYICADGTRIWSLMQLERQLRPEVYGQRRGGFLDRRRTRH